MRKHSIILLLIVIASIGKQSYGQSDSTRHSQNINIYGNYYAPWHQTIKDTSHKTVSDFGHYISLGLGISSDGSGSGTAALISYSMAYKSHLLSITRNGSLTGMNSPNTYNVNYFGLLLGESVRFQYLMLSISGGIAYTNINVFHYGAPGGGSYYFNEQSIVSFPVEIKLIGHFNSFLGFGLNFSGDALSLRQYAPASSYSPFYFGFCIVSGKWNKRKK